jgi:hypothetical protein
MRRCRLPGAWDQGVATTLGTTLRLPHHLGADPRLPGEVRTRIQHRWLARRGRSWGSALMRTAVEYSNRTAPGRTSAYADGREIRGQNGKSSACSISAVDGMQKVGGSNPLSSTAFSDLRSDGKDQAKGLRVLGFNYVWLGLVVGQAPCCVLADSGPPELR